MHVKKLIFALIATMLMLAGGYLMYNQSSRDGIRIAIFLPAIHPAMDEIEKGIKETLTQHSDQHYIFTTYNANGNKTLLQGQAQEISHNNYAAIFTIGQLCSHTMFEVERKKDLDTPIIFTAIDDPVAMGIIKSLKSSGNNLTGSIIKDNFDDQFDAILTLKPTIKTVLFVFDPGHGRGLDAVTKEVASVLKKRGITLKTAEIFSNNEIQQKVEPLLDTVDLVFIYTDHTTVSGIDSLISLCNRYHIPLYASDLNSSDKGAAAAYGITEYDHGRNAAEKAIAILKENKKPSEVPITAVPSMKLKINRASAAKQGLILTPEDIERVRAQGGEII
jgi:putative ABC transport system substrate-binding protein